MKSLCLNHNGINDHGAEYLVDMLRSNEVIRIAQVSLIDGLLLDT